jgi:hypothetical protein
VSRSRVQKRERLRAPVMTADPAALAAYAAELRPVVASLRELAEDATVRPAQRIHGRLYLRQAMLRRLRELEARIEAAAPASLAVALPGA